MRYKVYFVSKSGRICETFAYTIKDCVNISSKYGEVDVYEYEPKEDCYKYFTSVEVL